ncbi:MAG: hypothetical protein IKZ84_04360, partial [Victivallales bacterium]|nr:hypothetical protein [Victivallales bacterium]
MNSRILFAILVAASQIVPQIAKANHTLAMDGRNVYVITIPDDAIPAEKTAAQELQTHLKQMTGAYFAIVTASEYNGGP